MAIEGKITSLYTDKTMSEALLPRTNTKAVTDDKGVNLNAILDQVAYVDINNSEAAVAPLNADTLAGQPADNYASKSYVSNEIAKAQLSGGSGEGDIDLSGYATKDDLAGKLSTSGGTVTGSFNVSGNMSISNGDFNMNGRKVWNLATPTSTNDAATKAYVDDGLNTKAPAGYGLGTGGIYPSNEGLDLANLARGGFFRFDTSANPFQNGTMLVVPRDRDVSASQLSFGHVGTTKNVMALRSYSKNASENTWEYINPPMTAGTYYRTTERCNGKPVYTKYLNLGTLPSSGRKHIAIGSVLVQEGAKPISFDVYIRNSDGDFLIKMPTGDHAKAYTELWTNGAQWYVDVVANSFDLSGYTGHAFVKWIYE